MLTKMEGLKALTRAVAIAFVACFVCTASIPAVVYGAEADQEGKGPAIGARAAELGGAKATGDAIGIDAAIERLERQKDHPDIAPKYTEHRGDLDNLAPIAADGRNALAGFQPEALVAEAVESAGDAVSALQGANVDYLFSTQAIDTIGAATLVKQISQALGVKDVEKIAGMTALTEQAKDAREYTLEALTGEDFELRDNAADALQTLEGGTSRIVFVRVGEEAVPDGVTQTVTIAPTTVTETMEALPEQTTTAINSLETTFSAV